MRIVNGDIPYIELQVLRRMFDMFEVHVEIVQRHRTAYLSTTISNHPLVSFWFVALRTSLVLQYSLEAQLRWYAPTYRPTRVTTRSCVAIEGERKLLDVDLRWLFIPLHPRRVFETHFKMFGFTM
jgi:hypothetical protein